MTNHVLIACSKSKSQEPESDLVWEKGTSLDDWASRWDNPGLSRFEAQDLYTGRATSQQLEIVSSRSDSIGYVISAGAGLLKVSDKGVIPSYESTFLRGGPSVEDWHRLPLGGISNIALEEGDRIVAFAPTSYLRAISKDPCLDRVSEQMVASSRSCLGGQCGFPVNVHPRIKEVLGVSSADLNTELVRIFLQGGISEIEKFSEEAGSLPPLPERRRVDDNELLEIVREHHDGMTAMGLVRFVRDSLGVSASVERIGVARKIVSSRIEDGSEKPEKSA